VLLIDTGPSRAYLAAFDAGSGKQVWKTERSVGFLGSTRPRLSTSLPGAGSDCGHGRVELDRLPG